MRPTSSAPLGLFFAALSILLLTGCSDAYFRSGQHTRASVVDYLYPKKTEVAQTPSIPRLELPLRVGIAFVPEPALRGPAALSEKDKIDLMDRIAAEFRKYPFVEEISVIPSPYLIPQGGFDNLDQIRTMHGVDVIALVSFDQVHHRDQNAWSISYWTIVGAYLVEAEKNDTSTLMDAAVFDIPSRQLLFRAPGTSRIKGSASPVNLSQKVREDSLAGFQEASDQLVKNLEAELARFQEKVKARPERYEIAHRPGYTGGGSFGGAFALCAIAALAGMAALRRGGRR